MTIPCRKCLNCKKWRQYQWKFRLRTEYLKSSKTWFCTLTYRHIPPPAEITPSWQKYMKRLRKATSKEIRYFTVVEHGSKTGRVHLHSLIFCPENAELSDQLLWREIQNSWKDGFAKSNIVRDKYHSSINYICKYVTKEHGRTYASQNLGYPLVLPKMEKKYPKWYLKIWREKHKIPF